MLSRRNFLDGASLLVGNLALGTIVQGGEGGEDPRHASPEIRGGPRGEGPAPGAGVRAGVVGRQHLRQGRGLQAEGRGPEQDRRGPRRPRARSPSSRRIKRAGRDRRPDPRPADRRALPARTWKSRSIRSCSSRSPPRPTRSRRRSTSSGPRWTARRLTDSEVREVLKESKDSDAPQGGLGGEQGRRRRSSRRT